MTGTIPSLLLRRLLDDDPLDLDLLCRLRQEDAALLIARRRLFLRAVARCAHKGFTYDADSSPIEAWISERIEDSIRDILEEDLRLHSKKLPVEQPGHYELLMEHLGLTAEKARAAHVAFNQLPQQVRSAYFKIGIQGVHPESYSKNGGGTMDEIHAHILVAVNTLVQFRMMDGEGDEQ